MAIVFKEVRTTQRVLECATSISSYNKYGGRILLWQRDLALLRQGEADGVSFSIRGEVGAIHNFISAKDILDAVDRRVGDFFPFKETYFIAISPLDLPR